MLRTLVRIILALSAVMAVWLAGLAFYNSKTGLGVRATLGQPSGAFLYAVSLYQDEKIADAILAIHPVLSSGYPPALSLICGIINDHEPIAATAEECVKTLETNPRQRQASLTEVGIWAQEWETVDWLVDRRIAKDDPTAHFDRARAMLAAPTGDLDAARLMQAIAASNKAQDPRGQYAHAVSILNISADGALNPVLVEMLTRQPKLTAADAYFELAKLIQTGAVSSDLPYVDILLRADALGNLNAARYLAQFYLSNTDQDPTGSEQRRWLMKAAASGDPVAQFNLALVMINEPDDDSSLSDAIAYLDQSASAGFVPAMNSLGTILWQSPELLGRDVAVVRQLAIELLDDAADKGDVNALFNLGSIHLSQNAIAKAVPYFQKAAKLGSDEAKSVLDQLGDEFD